jgi:hypothetical protein
VSTRSYLRLDGRPAKERSTRSDRPPGRAIFVHPRSTQGVSGARSEVLPVSARRWSPDAPIQASPRLRAALVQRQTVRAQCLAVDGRSSASLSASAAWFAGSVPPTIAAGSVLRLEANRVHGVRAPRSQPRRTLGPPSFQRRRAGGSGGRRDSRRVRARCACSPLRSSAR